LHVGIRVASMPVRTALLLGFMAGIILAAALLWLFGDPPGSSGTEPLGGAGGVETALPVAARSDPRSTKKSPEALSEHFERPFFEHARESEAAAQLTGALQDSRPAPREQRHGRGRGRVRVTEFDAGALAASGFSPDDIRWIRERWEEAEMEKRYLADLESRDEEPPPGGAYSDIERELREDLGDDGYDAMLYATDQDNRVALARVQHDSIAYRAGLRDGSVVWSYDGQRVFRPKELATLSTTGRRGEPVEIVIVTDDGTRQLIVERNPLGAELVSARRRPDPD
jgi:hypothetical protein